MTLRTTALAGIAIALGVAACQDSVSVGEEALVFEEGLATITVGVDTSAFNALTDAFVANDTVAIVEMITSGRAYTIRNGTRALVLDRTLTRTKVRFIEGAHQNRVGHVPTDWVRKP